MLFGAASLNSGSPVITLPDGSVAGDDAALSEWLGRPVILRCASYSGPRRYESPEDFEREADWEPFGGANGSFRDSEATVVSMVSTGSLGPWDARRFRSNLVLEGSGEDELVGSSRDHRRRAARSGQARRPLRDGDAAAAGWHREGRRRAAHDPPRARRPLRRRCRRHHSGTRLGGRSTQCVIISHVGFLAEPPVSASGGIGRRAGFRCQYSQGCGGSSPPSRTETTERVPTGARSLVSGAGGVSWIPGAPAEQSGPAAGWAGGSVGASSPPSRTVNVTLSQVAFTFGRTSCGWCCRSDRRAHGTRHPSQWPQRILPKL